MIFYKGLKTYYGWIDKKDGQRTSEGQRDEIEGQRKEGENEQ